jgi:capsid assembly protease
MSELQTSPRRPAPRVLDAIMSAPWAIHEPALTSIIAVVEGLGEGPDALATRLGRPLDNARDVQVREGGVAIVSVNGPIVRYANMFTDISGATSLSSLALDLQTAVQSPAVSAIVLSIDSPGGEMSGLAEMADTIRTVAGLKPLVAYVGGLAASGGYWLASAAPEIVIDRSAMLGSIGVVMASTDTSERDAKAGIRRVEFVSSQSPAKRPDLATEAGRATVQGLVDRLATVFVDDVARARGVDPAHVLEQFGRGGMLVGSDAVGAGMADRLGSLEGLIAELAAARNSRMGRGNGAAAQSAHKGVSMSGNNAAAPEHAATVEVIATVEALASAYPTLVEAVRASAAAAGRQEGTTAERQRILGVEAQALPGHDALVAAMKADGQTTPEQAAVQILQAERGKHASHLQHLQGTAAQMPVVEALGGTVIALKTSDDRAREDYRKDPKLQAEFRSEDRYLAFLRSTKKLTA